MTKVKAFRETGVIIISDLRLQHKTVFDHFDPDLQASFTQTSDSRNKMSLHMLCVPKDPK